MNKQGKSFEEIYGERVEQRVAWRDRLIDGGARWQVPDWVIAELTESISHLQARMGMPQSRLRRVPAAVGELLQGRYHRHAKGVKSFLNDLLR